MSNTRRDIRYCNSNARRLKWKQAAIQQDAYLQELIDEGYGFTTRNRDYRRLPHPNDDISPSADGELGWLHSKINDELSLAFDEGHMVGSNWADSYQERLHYYLSRSA